MDNLQSLSQEGHDVLSEEEQDERVSKKLPSLRITKLKIAKLKCESTLQEGVATDSSDRSFEVASDLAESAEGYVNSLIAILEKRFGEEVKRKPVGERMQQTLQELQGNYSVKIISHRRCYQPELTKIVNSFAGDGSSQESTPTSFETEDTMIFLFRELRAKETDPLVKYAEVFVLTSGFAYHLINEDDCDVEFPKQIAKRVLQFNLKTLSSKQLTGRIAGKDLKFKTGEGTILTMWDYLGHITTTYKMPLKSDSSMYRLPCFCDNQDQPKKASMTVGKDLLRINLGLSLKDITAVLLQFSRICRGRESMKYRKKEPEVDGPEFDVLYHVRVMRDKSLLHQHNEKLKKKLEDYLQNERMKTGLLLSHTDLDKWYDANKFVLQRKKSGMRRYETISLWYGDPPSLEDILNVLRKHQDEHQDKISMDQLFLQFYDDSQERPKKTRDSLLKFVEGHFSHPEGMSLFRYCGQWLSIDVEYMTHLQKEFTLILENCQLDSSFLPLSWPYSGVDAPQEIKIKEKKQKQRRPTSSTKEELNIWREKIYKGPFASDMEISTDAVVFDDYLKEGTVSERVLQLFRRMHCHQAEEHYNEGYILHNDVIQGMDPDGKSGYLLGDRILVKNVELYDILYYKEGETYLIHVKEGFGNSIRDACSQIRISGDLIFRNIICNNNFDILEEMWKSATHVDSGNAEGQSYRSTVKACYKKLGKESFLRLFRNHQIIYVLAFRDERKAETQDVPFLLYPEDQLRLEFEDDYNTVIAELKRCSYLKQSGWKTVITDKVVRTTLKEAEEEINLRTKVKARRAFNILRQTMSNHKSSVAKMEIVHLFSYFNQFQMPGKRLTFKLCSISKDI